MKKSFALVSVLFLAIVFFSSCKNEDSNPFSLPEVTAPVIATNSTTENFNYSIVAKNYTKQEVYNIQVVSDSIKISYATNSVTSGQMEVLVELKDGTKLVSRNISGVLAANDYKKIKSPLSKVTLNYSNFTGQFALSLNNAF
ncbi:MAG: hypothetical protein C4517_17465 [Stygiobacter sp.]|nr:MAG: hypothetical protein C4517_17465 [Stygiobacter sp.]